MPNGMMKLFVDSINSNYPTITRTVLRNHVEAAIGDAPGRTVPSLSSIDRALDRNNKKRKRCTYLNTLFCITNFLTVQTM